jgi:hypothetical protein
MLCFSDMKLYYTIFNVSQIISRAITLLNIIRYT